MQKQRLIIIQILGIILLMCGYFISDQPDSESVMHFNLSAAHVIHAMNNDNVNAGVASVSVSSDDHTPHRTKGYKHFSFKVILTRFDAVYHYVPLLSSSYTIPLPENYSYLFYKEINPPPPKAC